MTAPDVDLQPRAAIEHDTDELPARPRLGGGLGMAFWQLLLGVALLLAWQGASGRLVDNFFISNPIDVAVRLWGWISDGSILRTYLGDRLCDDARLLHRGGRRSDPGHLARALAVRQPAAEPLSERANALPKVALAPLFVLWFGLGIESKVALAAVLVLFLVFLNTYCGRARSRSGLDRRRAPDAGEPAAGHLQGRHPVGDVVGVRRPQDRRALRADRRGAGRDDRRQPGLGYLVQFSGAQFDTAGVFAVLIVIALLAVALNYVVDVAQSRIERWRIVGR